MIEPKTRQVTRRQHRRIAGALLAIRNNPLWNSRLGTLGLVLIVVIIGGAVAGPSLSIYDPLGVAPASRLRGPSFHHLLGTDTFGRDIFTRTMYGGRVSLGIAAFAVLLALLIGGTAGVLAGYYGKALDRTVMRIMDVVFSFPEILLAIAISAVLGAGMRNVVLAIGIAYSPRFARITRSTAMTLASRGYVQAARALGAGTPRILRTHVVRNGLAPVVVQCTFSLATAIVAEAALGYLGLGVQAPTPSWGSMIQEGIVYMEIAPWLVLAPAAAIMASILAFNFLGDGLNDVLDPRLSTGKGRGRSSGRLAPAQ